MKICKQKNFFVIKVSLSWEWYGTFDEILHYKSFLLPPFSTNNQADCEFIPYDSNMWEIFELYDAMGQHKYKQGRSQDFALRGPNYRYVSKLFTI